jgi:hypothetical protein
MNKQNTLFLRITCFVMVSLLMACDENGDRPPNGQLQQVYEVAAIQLSVLESLPQQLKIDAEGSARTGGWSNSQLVPYEYIAPPADGIYEFDFKAQPPENAVTQAITPIKAGYTMNPLPENLKGVKIYAEQNNAVAMLEQSAPAALFEFKGSDEQDRFVIKLVDQEKINHARDLLAGITSKKPSVMGTIMKLKENYNANWSYHLIPESISFFDVAIEVCDANMRYVEEHLGEVGGAFLPGHRWCPWQSQLTKEIDLQ